MSTSFPAPAESARRLFPHICPRTLATVLLAGVAAVVAWELWARLVAPLWVGGPLEPAGLVQMVFGLSSRPVAMLIHFIVGVVLYPIGYLYIARPLARLILPMLPWWLVGAGFGVGLWVFALYGMAHLIAGLPAFLGFSPLAWASLVGHVIFGVVTAAVVRWREGGWTE